MLCVKCQKPVVVQYKTGGFCADCFTQSIEKRVRQGLWAQDWAKPDDRILLIHDKSTEAFVTERVVRQILGAMPVALDVKDATLQDAPALAAGYDKVVIPCDLDDELRGRFASLLAGGSERSTSHLPDSFVRPLVGVQDWEVREYAKLHGLPLTDSKQEDAAGALIASMEARVPGSKFALLKSLHEWENAVKITEKEE